MNHSFREDILQQQFEQLDQLDDAELRQAFHDSIANVQPEPLAIRLQALTARLVSRAAQRAEDTE